MSCLNNKITDEIILGYALGLLGSESSSISLKPEIIEKKDDCTTVKWNDDSETSVKLCKEDKDKAVSVNVAINSVLKVISEFKENKNAEDAEKSLQEIASSLEELKTQENDSIYTAFCIALAKRMYGNNTALHRMIDEHTSEYLAKQREDIKKAYEKYLADRKQERIDEQNRNHMKKVKRLAKQMRLEAEAAAYNEKYKNQK